MDKNAPHIIRSSHTLHRHIMATVQTNYVQQQQPHPNRSRVFFYSFLQFNGFGFRCRRLSFFYYCFSKRLINGTITWHTRNAFHAKNHSFHMRWKRFGHMRMMILLFRSANGMIYMLKNSTLDGEHAYHHRTYFSGAQNNHKTNYYLNK